MNFSIKIYPDQLAPFFKTWGEVKEECIILSEGLYEKAINFNLIDSDEDHPRLIIQELDKLRICEPSQIVKTVEKDQKNHEYQPDEFEDKVSIRYIYDRKIEFIYLDKIIYWNIDFGVKGLYEINEELMEEVPVRMLSDDLFSKFKKSLNANQYLITLETDLATNYLDPIWVMALVFCKLTKGVVFVDHSFPDYFLSPGYYEISELEAICANGLKA